MNTSRAIPRFGAYAIVGAGALFMLAPFYFMFVFATQSRTEIFNLTNTPPLANPNGVVGNAAFGTITAAGDPRVIQFGLKVNF
jgi:ABC-type glycerol-3-phosphate transport system permease component